MSTIGDKLRQNWPIMVINTSRSSIIGEIDFLQEFNIEQESLLRKQVNKFNKWAEEETKKLNKEAAEIFYDNYSDDYWKLYEEYPNLFRYSHFITCFSFFEYHLFDLCGLIKYHFNITSDVSDVRGKNDIDKIRKYLKNVVGIDFPDQSSYWINIESFKEIRNVLVHALGRLNTLNQTKLQKIKDYMDANTNLLTNDDLNRLKLSKDFIDYVLIVFTSFFNELYDACDIWARQQIR